MMRAETITIAAGLATLAAVAWAYPARPQDMRDVSGSIVRIQPTVRPGAVAEIQFENIDNNGPADNGSFPLVLDGLTAEIRFTWNIDDRTEDAITVTVPDGYVAVPPTLVVPEHTTGTVLIFPLEGVGM